MNNIVAFPHPLVSHPEDTWSKSTILTDMVLNKITLGKAIEIATDTIPSQDLGEYIELLHEAYYKTNF